MCEQPSSLTALTAHKQLLVVECEIHRAELGREWQNLCGETEELRGKVCAVASLASDSAAIVVAGTQIARKFFKPSPQKHSWGKTLINGARAGISVWLALRSRVR